MQSEKPAGNVLHIIGTVSVFVFFEIIFPNVKHLKKSTSKHLFFFVLQLVTNRGLYSVPGRTKQYLEGPR